MISFSQDENECAMNVSMVAENDYSESEVYHSSSPFVVEQPVLCRALNNAEQYHEPNVRKAHRMNESEQSFSIEHTLLNSRFDRLVSKKDLLRDDSREPCIIPLGSTKKRKSGKDTALNMVDSSPLPRKRLKNTGRIFSNGSRRYAESLEEVCALPITVRQVLEEERTFITRPGFQYPKASDCDNHLRPIRKLHHIPAAVTVRQVLDHFQKKHTVSNEAQLFCQLMSELFDENLANILLYPEEVPQYKSTMFCNASESRSPCEMYGCHFLLRLIVGLPRLLLSTTTPNNLPVSLLPELISLLQKNRQVCFREFYRDPTDKELQDWERTVTADMVDGCAFIPLQAAVVNADDDEHNCDMAFTPTKKAKD